MSRKIVVLLFGLIILLLSCNTTKPLLPGTNITLKTEDVSSIEAWIKITTNNIQLPTYVTLKQSATGGNTVTQDIILSTADSIIYIDSLLPNQTYKFQAFTQSSNQSITSNLLNITTMDTTSHEFSFEMFTFGGEAGSSVLNDVAIINENDIWAVGEIWIVDDTSSLGYIKYNAIHWDGSEWELKRLQYNNSTISPIRGILIMNPNDIYFAAGSVFHWDGISPIVQLVYSRLNLQDPFGTIEKLWSQSATAIYGVGNVGSLIFYNGQIWSQMESGTDLNINDIWGDYNEKTQQWEILAVASNIFGGFEKEVIKIDETDAQILNKDGIEETLRSVWFESNRKYYVVGSGTYEKNHLYEEVWNGDPLDITNYFENRIRGNDINDVYVVGAFGDFYTLTESDGKVILVNWA